MIHIFQQLETVQNKCIFLKIEIIIFYDQLMRSCQISLHNKRKKKNNLSKSALAVKFK